MSEQFIISNATPEWEVDPGNVTFRWSEGGGELLLTEKGTKSSYPIPYDRVETPLQLVGWLDHLLEKAWFDKRGARELIRLICEGRGWEYHDA